MKRLSAVLCLFLVSLMVSAQEQIENLDIETSDSQMFTMSIDLKIRDGETEEVVSDHSVQHVTVSGKPVTLNINGGNFKAAVRLTLYHMEGDTLLLLTQSTIYFLAEGRRRMLSTAKSIPIEAGEKVLFFPLGVFSRGDKSEYNCMLELDVSRYQPPVQQE